MQPKPKILASVADSAQADDRASLLQFISALSTSEYSPCPPTLRKLLLRLLQTPNADYQQLSRVSAYTLKSDTRIKQLIEISQDGQTQTLKGWIGTDEFRQILVDPLLRSLLLNLVIKDLELESLFTKLRKTYLDLLINRVPLFNLRPHINFMVALACQCFKNEYIYASPPQEGEQLEKLTQKIERLLTNGSLENLNIELEQLLAVYGMYKPLWTITGAHNLLEYGPGWCTPSFRQLIREQVEEYFEEQAIKGEIPSIGISDNETSLAVREQYEESPYPRWFNITLKEPKRFSAFIKSKFPDLDYVDDGAVTKILVAGCGTGRHAISVADKYLNSRVLAVDISKASLAYAIRKARELNIRNVEFCHSDILCLPKLSERYHLVEAVGVLHHMDAPASAWKILSDLLMPGGLMRIGLYSKRGRGCLTPTKHYVSERMVGNQLNELRAIRQEIIAMRDNTEAQAVLMFDDFFVLSEFRDLVYHAHETQFTLTKIADVIKELGLEFVGFEHVAQNAQKRYQELYPESGQSVDLILWDKVERDYPAAFGSMYRFWVRKRSESFLR